MTSPEESVRRLESEFADAMNRMYVVGNGLAALRAELDAATAAPAAPVRSGSSAHAPVVPPAPTAPSALAVPGPRPQPAIPSGQQPPTGYLPPQRLPAPTMPPSGPPPPRAVPAEQESWWQREGTVARVLGVAGALVMLSGLVMLLVMAIQRGLFGPVPRVVGGALLAIALLVVAARVRCRSPGNVGGVAIAATGFAAAYLDVVAVTAIYHWLHQSAGLALAAVIAGAGLWLARRWNSELLGSIVVLGVAVLAPFVGGMLTWITPAFMVVLTAATWPAQLGRSWPALHVARVLPTTILVFVSGLITQGTGADPAPIVIIAAVLALVTTVGAVHAARTTDNDVLASVILVAGSLPLLLAPFLIDTIPGSILAGATALAYLTVVLVLSSSSLGGLTAPMKVALTSVGTLAVLHAVVRGTPDSWVVTSLLLLAAAYLALAAVQHSQLTAIFGWSLAAIALVCYLPTLLPVMSRRIMVEHGVPQDIISSLLAGLVIWTAHLALRTLDLSERGRGIAVAAWTGILVAVTAAVIHAGTTVGNQFGIAEVGFVGGHAVATLLWMGVAAYLLMHGLSRARDASIALRTGLVFAGLAVLKLFLFDLMALDGMWRVAAFVGAGALLLAMGTGYARALERFRDRTGAATP